MITKIAEDSKTGSTRKLVITAGNKDQVQWVKVIEERDLIAVFPHAIGQVRGSGRDMFINVYELGPLLYDLEGLSALNEQRKKDIRYSQYVALREEFGGTEEDVFRPGTI